MQDCIFCNISKPVLENEYAVAIYDKYPVNPGHMLIIPKRHIADYFAAAKEERQAIDQLLAECKKLLDKKFNPDGYNIGINCGACAGQTIFHLHVHLIPRYQGDMVHPQGGVRGVIPERRLY